MTAARKRKRPGRPRLHAPRHPSGKVVQRAPALREQDAVSVASEARQRQFGVSPAQSTDPALATVLGRLWRSGGLSPDRARAQRLYDAGEAYRQLRRDYDAIMGVRPLASGSDLERSKGHDTSDGTEEAYVARERRVRSLHAQCFVALAATRNSDVLGAIELVVVDDQPASGLIDPLRVALNAVGKVLRC